MLSFSVSPSVSCEALGAPHCKGVPDRRAEGIRVGGEIRGSVLSLS